MIYILGPHLSKEKVLAEIIPWLGFYYTFYSQLLTELIFCHVFCRVDIYFRFNFFKK